MRIAILALQGAFAEHAARLHALGAETTLVRSAADWAGAKDGLVIPGGESTAMRRIMSAEGLTERIAGDIRAGLPVLGTCAGLIMLAERVEGEDGEGAARRGEGLGAGDELPPRLSTMDCTVRRNAYGRQLASFRTEGVMCLGGEERRLPMTFIRAPFITEAGRDVEVLARVDDRIVAAQQGAQLVTAFHPELDEDVSVHRYFLSLCR